ncbi:hypothetical protein [Nocardiopsis dassonvillei]|uniref:hypothetical protein n=1 Tax=Nocardiopsis dassonvillei TaxID=2014 RepID=UPI00362CB39A
MDPHTDLYCEVFVGRTTATDARALLSAALGVGFSRGTARLGDLFVEVRRNKEHVADETDFLFWPVVVELDSEEGAAGEKLVGTTAAVLRALWGAGYPAIAACDFEDVLPWSGGIGSPVMPPEDA